MLNSISIDFQMSGLYGGSSCGGGGSSDSGSCYPGVVGSAMSTTGGAMPPGMGAAAAAAAGLYSGCPPGVGMGPWTNPASCGGVIPPGPGAAHPHPYSHHPYDHPAVGSLAAAYATTPYGTAADRYLLKIHTYICRSETSMTRMKEDLIFIFIV